MLSDPDLLALFEGLLGLLAVFYFGLKSLTLY